MNLLSASHLAALIAYRPNPSISLFIPTDREKPERASERLHVMLRDIEERLTALGLSSAFVEESLQPVQGLASSGTFWEHQSKGVAIFLAPDSLHILRLPYPFEGQAAVSNQFHIRPLLPLISADGRFYILTLRRDAVELWQGTDKGLDRVELQRVPKNLSEIWRQELSPVRIPTMDEAAEITYWPATFAGPGLDAGEEDEGDILAHFRRVDEGLSDLLDGRAPLILAGEKGYPSLFRSVSHYPKLLAQGIEMGEGRVLNKDTLHQRGLGIVQPRWHREKKRAWAEYERLARSGSGVVSSDLEEILPAAYNGEVKTLFVPLDVQRWGTFEAETGYTVCHAKPEAGDMELLDQAAGYTFVRGGQVYVRESKEVQMKDSAAAVFRY